MPTSIRIAMSSRLIPFPRNTEHLTAHRDDESRRRCFNMASGERTTPSVNGTLAASPRHYGLYSGCSVLKCSGSEIKRGEFEFGLRHRVLYLRAGIGCQRTVTMVTLDTYQDEGIRVAVGLSCRTLSSPEVRRWTFRHRHRD